MEIKHSFALSISILNTETGHIKFCVQCLATSANISTVVLRLSGNKKRDLFKPLTKKKKKKKNIWNEKAPWPLNHLKTCHLPEDSCTHS